jgi:acyl carrier protein
MRHVFNAHRRKIVTEDIASQVIHFVAEFTGDSPDKITLSTEVSDDLGIAGDDGEALIDAFSDRFDVDVSGFWLVYDR